MRLGSLGDPWKRNFRFFNLFSAPPPAPPMSVPEEGDGQVLVKCGSLKISLTTFEILVYFPQC